MNPVPCERWHRWVDHTSEVQLEVGAESLAGLAVEAGRALGLLMLRGAPEEVAGPARILEVSSVDRDALLVDWLNEILFVAETESWVPVEFTVEESSPTRLRVAARGVPVEEVPSSVKAATFHGLKVEEHDGSFRAEVIFDV
ncbi:MAG: protein archease [Acidobacteriota bacterium]|nr:protein archease [Acidobacteriota bacterium]